MFFVLGLISCKEQKTSYQPLELIGLYQLDSLHGLKFDLSGIVKIQDSVYIIADKPWNKFLYQIAFGEKTFMVTKKVNLSLSEKLDLEGIDHCNGTTYMVNERQGIAYQFESPDSISEMKINFDSVNQNPKTWGNSGWEGVASDCQSGKVYLIKEREPRSIFVIDAQSNKIIDSFSVPEKESNDFSDAKFEKGHLYVIERNGNYLAKIDPESKEVVAKYHYRDVASHPNGKLYGPTEYGMGEALLLTEDEIWIGLDNNGLKVTDHAQSTYGMSGKSPVILKFRRPEGF